MRGAGSASRGSGMKRAQGRPAGQWTRGSPASASDSTQLPYRPAGRAPATGPAPPEATPPGARPRPVQAPSGVRASRAPPFRAGAAHGGFGTVRGQQTPNRVFKETLERGGFWGIKFPPAASGLVSRMRPGRLAARGGVCRSGGRDSRRLRTGLRSGPGKFKAAGLVPVESDAASVELVSGPVRPAPRRPRGSPWPLGHV